MTKYLKQFELTVQYEEYINSNIAVLPNVSVTNDDNKVHYNPIPNYLTFTAEQDNSTISLTSKTSPDIKYSLNGGTWMQWDYSAITLNIGDTVYIKGNNSNGFSVSNSNYNQFQMTGKIGASGNIMSLLYENDFERQLTIPGEYCFYRIFYGCTSLTTAPELPATTLAINCYNNMFRGCTSLTTAPELPATTLATQCYWYMFQGCTRLTTAPKLPATILASWCYAHMFEGCTSLTTAPELPVTTLANYCYQYMFDGCTRLTTAPKLPATILASLCYAHMFEGCTSLTTAPELPATTLAHSCYMEMFYGCTRLTTAPKLPATTLANNCYQGMFYGCTSLTTAPELPATTLKDECYRSMFRGCTSLTSSPELPATILSYQCYAHMFYDCTSLTAAPELPATTLANYCYQYMFDGCTRLTTAPKLPATTLANYCYQYMFDGCTRLTTAPKLPATILASFCYYYMFRDCTTLTIAPKLPATTLANDCYHGMFSGCTSLTTAPELPATTLAEDCYFSMFYRCTALTTAPELPATTLANDCYRGMFSDCTSLTTAPKLPATTLANDCYGYMFDSCTSLTTAPNLPATTLAAGCYQYMFYNCTKLNYIMMLATNIRASLCLDNWVLGVASTGTFIKHPNMTSLSSGTSGIPTGWATYNVDYYKEYLTFVALEDGTFTFTQNALQYSLDNGTTWTTLAANTASPTITTGNKIMWKQTGLTPNSSNGIGTFSSTGNFDVQGNIMSLLYGDDFLNKTTLSGKNYAFEYLFNANAKVISAQNLVLPATTLASYCYEYMFKDCTALTTAPKLYATTLVEGCYFGMFYRCDTLITSPELPATTLANYCYSYMFYGCTSLTTAPNLSATTLTDYCYHSMFYGCTSLTTAPKLPATTLADYCYYSMFNSCTSLTTAPKLPATTLTNDCYHGMFYGCTALTTAPNLPSTTLVEHCYKYMFYGCTRLNSITCLATDISATNCTSNWVSGVASSGTFIKAESMASWTSGVDGIPANWIVEDKQEIQCLTIYVDDFNFLEELDDFIKDPESKGSNGYYLTNNTISYQGGVYYVWNSIDDTRTPYGTLLTTTNDFNTLYNESLEQNKTNHFNSFMSRANSDQTILYNGWSEKSMLLIKIEVANGQTIIWVDDFDITDEIENPYECGANMYEYNGETMTYQGESYYVWNMVEGVDGAYNNQINKLLTTTVDYDTLYSQSLEDNVGNTFDALFCRMSDDNDEVYDDTSTQYLVKVVISVKHLRMWVDDFPTHRFDDEGSRTAKMQLEINNPDSEHANPYIYNGDTITYDGNTYYLWRAEEGYDNDYELTRYFATSTVDFDELYAQSLEDDINNTFTSAIGMFDDNEEIYCAQGLQDDGTDIHYLVKIEKI